MYFVRVCICVLSALVDFLFELQPACEWLDGNFLLAIYAGIVWEQKPVWRSPAETIFHARRWIL